MERDDDSEVGYEQVLNGTPIIPFNYLAWAIWRDTRPPAPPVVINGEYIHTVDFAIDYIRKWPSMVRDGAR